MTLRFPQESAGPGGCNFDKGRTVGCESAKQPALQPSFAVGLDLLIIDASELRGDVAMLKDAGYVDFPLLRLPVIVLRSTCLISSAFIISMLVRLFGLVLVEHADPVGMAEQIRPQKKPAPMCGICRFRGSHRQDFEPRQQLSRKLALHPGTRVSLHGARRQNLMGIRSEIVQDMEARLNNADIVGHHSCVSCLVVCARMVCAVLFWSLIQWPCDKLRLPCSFRWRTPAHSLHS